MDRESQLLLESFVAAYPRFVVARAVAWGLDSRLAENVAADGLVALEQGLRSLFEQPLRRQAETPLEVVRTTMSTLVEALRAAGVDPSPSASGWSEDADPYDLGPASAAELGDEAAEAAIAWGVRKTRGLARPLVLLVNSNLMDRGPFEKAARSAGYRLEVARPEDLEDRAPVVAFVDIEVVGADAAISRLAEIGVRVIGYGPHVDDLAMMRARVLGAVVVESRRRVLKNPGVFLPPLV